VSGYVDSAFESHQHGPAGCHWDRTHFLSQGVIVKQQSRLWSWQRNDHVIIITVCKAICVGQFPTVRTAREEDAVPMNREFIRQMARNRCLRWYADVVDRVVRFRFHLRPVDLNNQARPFGDDPLLDAFFNKRLEMCFPRCEILGTMVKAEAGIGTTRRGATARS